MHVPNGKLILVEDFPMNLAMLNISHFLTVLFGVCNTKRNVFTTKALAKLMDENKGEHAGYNKTRANTQVRPYNKTRANTQVRPYNKTRANTQVRPYNQLISEVL
jgi:hypothetical protein